MIRLIKPQKLNLVISVTVCDTSAGKMVAVHLAGKRKEIAKVYMALVVQTDGEDFHLLYKARAGCFYH